MDERIEALDKMLEEICANIENFEIRAAPMLNNAEALLALRLEQYEILTEAVERHRRHIEFLMGKPIEPKIHFGEAILVGVVGGAA